MVSSSLHTPQDYGPDPEKVGHIFASLKSVGHVKYH